MGFGTQQQLGNRSGQTLLANLFRGNIGTPQPVGTTQQPTQLLTLLRTILQGQGIQPQPQPPAVGLPQQPGQTPLSAVTAQPPSFAGGNLDVIRQQGLTNPFNRQINQRFIR